MKKHFALVALALSTVTLMSSAHAAYEKSNSFASKPASQETIAQATAKTPCTAQLKGNMYEDRSKLMHPDVVAQADNSGSARASLQRRAQ